MDLVKRNYLCLDLSMRTVIGVDAGGTGTRAVALDESGTVVARGVARPGNPASIGSMAASCALADLVAADAAVGTVDDLVNWANRGPRDDFAALAPQICRLAAHDVDASKLASQAADRLLSTLDSLPPVDGPLVLAGGLLGSDT